MIGVLRIAGVFAAVALTVHILYRRGYWTYDRHASLVRLMYTGCFVQLTGVTAFVVYLVFGCMYQTGKIKIKLRKPMYDIQYYRKNLYLV